MNVEGEFLGSMETKGVEDMAPVHAAAIKKRAEDTQCSQVHRRTGRWE